MFRCAFISPPLVPTQTLTLIPKPITLGLSLALTHCPVQDFYEDVFEEMDKFGEVENLNVCDNIADHMVGSVYVKFVDETAAAKALQARGLP